MKKRMNKALWTAIIILIILAVILIFYFRGKISGGAVTSPEDIWKKIQDMEKSHTKLSVASCEIIEDVNLVNGVYWANADTDPKWKLFGPDDIFSYYIYYYPTKRLEYPKLDIVYKIKFRNSNNDILKWLKMLGFVPGSDGAYTIPVKMCYSNNVVALFCEKTYSWLWPIKRTPVYNLEVSEIANCEIVDKYGGCIALDVSNSPVKTFADGYGFVERSIGIERPEKDPAGGEIICDVPRVGVNRSPIYQEASCMSPT
ncbi:MAG: hypothetical protein AABX71_00620 [Nanoarchaeota archaeon]